MKRTGSDNPNLVNLIHDLKKLSLDQKVKIWKRIAEDLESPTRKRREVNLDRLGRYTKANETVIVPGKVLGSGEINHKLKVAAFKFSRSASEKLDAMTIRQLMKDNPKGKGVRILG
ncbi:MAG: 50S ribosomal protein L18e [Candidatus Nanoarchaeia archaeon]|nr:50S ribosomal protein L18e [Candidatus Nanoarchaeia archaeon]